MAIYHLTAKTVSRGTASAKARHDYIEREGRYHSDHKEVSYSESGNMPSWAEGDPNKYWDSADIYERGNGRLFKQLEFALPKELKADEQKELVQNYVNQLTSTKDGKLPYSFAIHKGHERENPHCHLMVSERPLDRYDRSPETWFKRANSKTPELGGSKKTTELMPKEWLKEIREKWSLQANKALEMSGHEARIDHRSLQDQGIDREPTQHLGPTAAAMERKGIQTDRGRQVAQSKQDNTISQAELAKLKEQKAILDSGINHARERFEAEKERRQQEQERQYLERERREEERQARLAERQERERQEKAEKLARERQERSKRSKDRGGMSL